ncbi:Uncharacterised protein [Mycobacteroides abscessus]|nr:Uncharacterised protein [Mycobacteroides abscessus]
MSCVASAGSGLAHSSSPTATNRCTGSAGSSAASAVG